MNVFLVENIGAMYCFKVQNVFCVNLHVLFLILTFQDGIYTYVKIPRLVNPTRTIGIGQ